MQCTQVIKANVITMTQPNTVATCTFAFAPSSGRTCGCPLATTLWQDDDVLTPPPLRSTPGASQPLPPPPPAKQAACGPTAPAATPL